MKERAHRQLVRRFETQGSYPIPEGMNDSLCEFLEYWLEEEEAEFLLSVPEFPESLASVAERVGRPEDETKRMLKTLIDKTLVIDHQVEGVDGRLYSLASVIAWTENYFHRYVDLNAPNRREIDAKLGQWLEALKASEELGGPGARLGRIVPIEKAITDTRGVVPISEATKIIDEASYVSVMRCPCRSSGHLAGTGCDYPMEVCMSMDDYARYQVEYGYAREISKEEAKRILKECEERGLPHVTDNIKGSHSMLCGCCPCHCIGLAGFRLQEQAPIFAKTAFLCAADLEQCRGSGECVEKCAFDAIELKDGKAQVSEARCIGCGMCTTVCPQEALSLKPRPPEKAERYYETVKEYLEDSGLKGHRHPETKDDLDYIH